MKSAISLMLTKRTTSLKTVLVVLMILTAVSALAPSAAAQASLKDLYTFKGGTDGANPSAGLIFDAAGNLYGTTAKGGVSHDGVVFKLTLNADGSWTESVLHSFTGADGANPHAGLIFDAAGNLYGTTSNGGTSNAGTVFKLTPNSDGSWKESVLHSFTGADGASPQAGLIFDAAENLYGTTNAGGDPTCGCGVVFKLTANLNGSWTESVLKSFTAVVYGGNLVPGPDGGNPQAGLIFDAAGNLYSTTREGGGNICPAPSPCGVVFKLAPNPDGSWTESVLHSFGYMDGYFPSDSLIFDHSGNLYGTAFAGPGSTNACPSPDGCGVVFKLTPNPDGSWKESLLYKFTGGRSPSSVPDGAFPTAGLVFDKAGNLYGTTSGGGPGGDGVIFKMVPNLNGSWTESLLHSFLGPGGANPQNGNLIWDKAGNLYGTTANGGGLTCNCGVVFEMRGTTLAPTSMTIKSSVNPSLFIQPVTFTTTSVATNPSLGSVTGTVTFTDGATALGTAPIVGGHATITTDAVSLLGIGTHNIVAYYSGSNVFASKTASLKQVVTAVVVSPTSLNFGDQAVGTTSAPQVATLTNVSFKPDFEDFNVNITRVVVTGNFVIQANTCVGGVSSMQSCTVKIAFRPAGTGKRYGNLWIYDDGGGSPQTVALTGVGGYLAIQSSADPSLINQRITFTTTSVEPGKPPSDVTGTVTFKDGSLTLGTVPISNGHASISTPAQHLGIGSHVITAYYSGNSVFPPTSASLTQVITQVTLSPGSLDYGWWTFGLTSVPETVTLKNLGTTSISITKLLVTGDFRIQTKTCGATLAAGASCMVNIVFHATLFGFRFGDLWVYDSGGGSPQKVNLTGVSAYLQ
jgi:uncharacterized repeat protein (TIGR03803 family)